MKKLIFIIFVLLLLASASVTLAQTKLIVPIPSAGQTVSQIADPVQYIRTVYQFSLGFGGLAAMGIIVFAAIKRIVSAGNVAQVGDANDMIKQAVIGLVLLFSAFLILYTINPNLVSLKLTDLELIKPVKELGLDESTVLAATINQYNQSKNATAKAVALREAAERTREEAVKSGNPLLIAQADFKLAEAVVMVKEASVQWNKDSISKAYYDYTNYDSLKNPGVTKDDYKRTWEASSDARESALSDLTAAKKALVGARLKLTELQGGAIGIYNQL